jgi:hypothetical protein
MLVVDVLDEGVTSNEYRYSTGNAMGIIVVIDREEVECCATARSATDIYYLQLSCELHIVMSNILELNCWLIGDEPRSIFPVKLASSKTVGYMRAAILPKMENLCSDNVAKSLMLWKVSCLI